VFIAAPTIADDDQAAVVTDSDMIRPSTLLAGTPRTGYHIDRREVVVAAGVRIDRRLRLRLRLRPGYASIERLSEMDVKLPSAVILPGRVYVRMMGVAVAVDRNARKVIGADEGARNALLWTAAVEGVVEPTLVIAEPWVRLTPPEAHFP